MKAIALTLCTALVALCIVGSAVALMDAAKAARKRKEIDEARMFAEYNRCQWNFLLVGERYREEGFYNDAVVAFRDAALMEDSWAPHAGLALAYLDQGKIDEGLNELRMALGKDQKRASWFISNSVWGKGLEGGPRMGHGIDDYPGLNFEPAELRSVVREEPFLY